MTADDRLARPLDRAGPAPLHDQIAARIRELIASSAWPPHYKLPAEPVLAARFGVSRGTIRRALKTLTQERLLVQVQGRGTFVAATTLEQPIAQEMLSLAEGLERQGVAFETEVVGASLTAADVRLAALLGIEPGDAVFELVRRRSVAGVWVAFLVNRLRTDVCPGIERQDFGRRTLFDTLEQVYRLPLAWARRTFEAQSAQEEVAARLEIPVGSPVLYLEQVTYLADGRPVEYSDVWIRGDRLRLSSILKRASADQREEVAWLE
ncbi:MAG TPA: GntR family transcriptional regulator [Candidatus Dormibacteraeota bacterium]|nr:GntR family transcriptional regulator [Candidatus Dormibacteraeota bacterium]